MGDRQQSIPHIISYSENDEFGDWIEILPSTVCLYTGKEDKNGVKIFKGDICDVTVFAYDGSDAQHIGDVIYDNACFFVGDDSDFCMPLYEIDDTEACAEVIGTIFDKPKEATP